MDRLSIKHHLLVAALTPAKQKHWLTQAAADADEAPWTAARLKAALDAGEDLPVTGWVVVVKCQSAEARDALMARLDGEGYGVKAVDRRARKPRGDEEAA